MTAAPDVIEILDLLEAVDADPRLVGGWGVDALARRQTRAHRDLDLTVDADRLDPAVAALEARGWVVEVDWLPVRVELRDAERLVDLHPLHFRPDGSAWQTGVGDATYEYPAECWTDGVVADRAVRCVGIRWQLAAHAGYEPREVDRHDLDLLDRLVAIGEM